MIVWNFLYIPAAYLPVFPRWLTLWGVSEILSNKFIKKRALRGRLYLYFTSRSYSKFFEYFISIHMLNAHSILRNAAQLYFPLTSEHDVMTNFRPANL
jgi:hypothetical protein